MIPLVFSGPIQPIIALLADPVAELLTLVLPGWTGRPSPNVVSPQVRVDNTRGGYRIEAATLPGGVLEVDEAITAAGAAGGTLTAVYVGQLTAHIELHAAAWEMDGAAIVAVGGSGAGKSTLALRLASLGYRLIGDDRVGLRLSETGDLECVALGVAPKARLPLPETVDDGYATFVDRWTKATYPGVAFLSLPDELTATLGEPRPVQALILLDRSANASPGIAAADTATIVRNLVEHGLAPSLGTGELIVLAERIAQSVATRVLSLSESQDAARLLIDHYGGAVRPDT